MKTTATILALTVLVSALGSLGVTVVPAVVISATGTVITPSLSAFVKDALDRASIPGLSMGVVRLGKERNLTAVELTAWGRQTEERGDDLLPDTLFALASCSKAFLVTAVGILIDDYAFGRNATPLPQRLTRFDWDTQLADLLPDEWGLEDRWAKKKLKLHDAFSHVSGVPRHDFSYRPGDTAEDILQHLKILPPAYELRERWTYNNQMFMVGAHLVAKLAGTSYPVFVASRIFAPLNMTSTTFSPSAAAKTGKLTQTWTRGSRRIPFLFPDAVAELFAGAGGIISSAEDMTKWLAALLNGGTDPQTNVTVIPPSVFAEMTTARAIVSGVPTSVDTSLVGYGMGWYRMSYRGHDVLYHDGAIPGFSLLVAFLPSDDLGAVFLTNMDEKQDDIMTILFRVIDEALGLVPSTALPANEQSDGTSETQQITNSTDPLPLDLAAYAGLYEDAAYGPITFCTPADTSPYCLRVLSAFAPIEAHQTPDLNPNRLYAAWPRVWSTHARLEHTGGTSFALLFPGLYPTGYGANHTPFEYWDSQNSVGRAEFVIEHGKVAGFGLIMDEQAAAARARRTGGGAREIGDAWFVKKRNHVVCGTLHD